MMRALLFLSLVGAAIYGFLVFTEDALTDAKSKDRVAIQILQNRSADERLSSWDSYLPSRSQNRQLATSQQPATLPSQEKNEPKQSLEQYRLATSENRSGSSKSDGLISGSSIAPPAPAQVATEPTTESLATKPPVRKSSKRSRSAKHGVAVATADPWNGRWSRRVERRRGFGLFMFRPVPRFAQGR